MSVPSVGNNREVPSSIPPVTAGPALDDRIYALVVLEQWLDTFVRAARFVFEACILRPVADLLETIQMVAIAIMRATSAVPVGGHLPPVGIRNRNNNCWAIAPMQIVMNSQRLQRQIMERDDPQMEPLRDFIREYNNDQAHGKIFSRTIDSNTLRRCFNRVGGDGEDANEAWRFLLNHLPTPPQKYDLQEGYVTSFTDGLSNLFMSREVLEQQGLPEVDMLVCFERMTRQGLPVDEMIQVYGEAFACESFIEYTPGHFLTYVKKPDGKWWCCDDLVVRRASQAEIDQALHRGCIHYYAKVEEPASTSRDGSPRNTQTA